VASWLLPLAAYIAQRLNIAANSRLCVAAYAYIIHFAINCLYARLIAPLPYLAAPCWHGAGNLMRSSTASS